jgi:hypothetical protein
MAQEIKNTFLKSKMNKDLDDRLLPNGEYKDARNISVGRSEDSDVGALENVIGNNLVTGTDIGNGLTIIGIENSNSTDELFVFLTDYTDPSPTSPTNAPSTSKHYIYAYNSLSSSYTRLVQGEFLNFSTTNRIIGINLVENLLFWTDNRNQPRKINIDLAIAFEPGGLTTGEDYYNQEHQISVAKYNPYQSIELYNRADLEVLTGATTTVIEISGNRVTELLPLIGATVVCSEAATPTQGTDYVKVISILAIGTNGPTRITVSPALNSAPTVGQFVTLIKSTMTNKNSDTDWPGDPDFLEDKFVRFSYRFKFDDNEYSLMAPFTQIAYIPKQNGYFINGDEDSAYQSTIIDFMENQVQNIGLIIPLPSSANKIISDYKISELEILFRESDAIAVKVLESVTSGEIAGASGVNNYYTYEYQSRKPYRTLPEAQTVRVYDRVPVRAFSQEIAGNRIIYGNFRDQHTPPSNINYNCRIAKKSTTGAYNNWVEYPNNSVKRNRNYQVGFVLADKFGRQSPVILSSVDLGMESNGQFYSGSTIYSPYDILSTDTDVDTWFGDVIQVLVNEPINSEINSSSGTPGLYAIKQQAASTGEGFAITAGFSANVPAITNNTFTFTLDDAVSRFPNNVNVPQVGDSMRGAYEDFVKVILVTLTGTTYVVTTAGRISDIYLREDDIGATVPDLKFAYTINDLGWYSYKIVVKQTEQEYYNVYLPGITNGYPGQNIPDSGGSGGTLDGKFPANEVNLTAHTVLFNDNINKIPRDLAEVGPEQKQFRSSVVLYGRITNTLGSVATTSNAQYYPRLSATGKNAIDHTAIAIAEAKDFNMSFSDLSATVIAESENGVNGNLAFYQIETNPLIARISTTEKSIGATVNASAGNNMLPFLAIYETEPVESLLDIYWETTSTGLIVDLNADIASTNTGVAGFINLNWEFRENTPQNTSVTPTFFSPINNEGEQYATAPTGQLVSAIDGLGASVNFFSLLPGVVGTANEGKFEIKYTGPGMVFNSSSRIRDVYTFVLKMTTSDGEISNITIGGIVGGFGALQNRPPTLAAIANIVKTKDDAILIPFLSVIAENGTILPGLSKKEGLLFSFSAAGGSVLPDNWVMDPDNGQLTQDTPGVGSLSRNFIGNSVGIYNIKLKVTDASGTNTNNTSDLYEPLVVTQVLSIRIDYSSVNPEAVSTTCVITPVATNPNGTTSVLSTNSPVNSFAFTSMMYYISAGDNIDVSSNGDDFFQNGIPGTQRTDNLYYHRIGTGAHTKGSLVFTSNLYVPWNGVSAFNSVRVPVTTFYYRIAGDAQWISLPRVYEDNRAGKNNVITSPSQISNQNTVVQSFDSPDISNPGATFNFNLLFDYGPNPMWEQTVRAINYINLTTVGQIEYAILMEGLSQTSGASTIFNTAKSWLQVDDLHYPTCVPWQGTNAVTANGAGNYFKYFRSAGANNSTAYVDISTSTLAVFAETPYGDYVDGFYTGATNNIPFIPANSQVRWINVKLDRAGIGLVPWTTYNGALTTQPATTPIDLQWVVGYDEVNGTKVFNGSSVQGVGAVQVSGNQIFSNTQGTLRITKN